MTDMVLQNKFFGFNSTSLLIFNVSGNSSGPFIKLCISAVKEIKGQGGDIAGVGEGFFCVVFGRSEIRLENEALFARTSVSSVATHVLKSRWGTGDVIFLTCVRGPNCKQLIWMMGCEAGGDFERQCT